MKIGVVADRLDAETGGGFTFHHSVLNSLHRAKTSHEIIVLSRGPVSDELARTMNCIDVDARYPERPPEISAVQAAASDLELDIVWFTYHVSEVLTVPFFTTVWDLEHRKQPYFPEVSHSGWDWNTREKHFSAVLPRAARIFVGTETGKQEIIRFYRVDDDNVVVNPFFVPEYPADHSLSFANEVLEKYGLQPNYLFYPAQFWPHKNHVNLFEALAILDKKYGLAPTLVLTGYDAGNLDFVRAAVARSGLEQRVRFLGFIPKAEVAGLYRRAAALVYPSYFGPDNLPPLEAFSFGCPVVASDVSGSRDEIGGAAALFDPSDPAAMAAQIASVLTSAELRRRMVAHGVSIVAGRTPDAYVEKALNAINAFEPMRRNWRNDFFCK